MLTIITLPSLQVLQLPSGHLSLPRLHLQSAGLCSLPGLGLLLPPVVVQDVPLDDTPQLVEVQLGVGGLLLSQLFLFRLGLRFGFFTGLFLLGLFYKI